MTERETKFLSKTERKYFDALARADSEKAAANLLGISPQTLYNWKYVLKKRFKQRRGWINTVIAQKRRSKLIRSLLTEKIPLEAPGLETSDLDEEEVTV